jgi:hypothetical protein
VTPEIADGEILRRGILFRDLIWDRRQGRIQISLNAFLLRPRDKGELSVQCAALETTAATFQRLPRSEVLAEVLTERVRQLQLDVEPRPSAANPAHAAILGVPVPDFHDTDAPQSRAARAKALELVDVAEPVAHRTVSFDALVQRLIEADQVAP